ncbi:MAG: SDR family NAD(P)-dependent oxidoreductase [Deltaproteobacteria bacterium]|nr:SDR family NAD(P)-dependent oxidoreductase [Deltaproteobacteria bacterium]
MGLLDGKVAVITGAGGGLGRTHALLFASEGARIVVNDLGGARDGTGGGSAMADQVVKEIKAAGGEAVSNYDSVATPEGGAGILKTALDAFGRVDILVNNAGILRDKTLIKTEEPDWDAVISVHLKGTYCVTRPIFTHMKERGGGGVIVNTSSTSGLIGNFGQCNYGAAKAGIAGFTRCLAQEGSKYGIRVWGLAPVAFTRLTEDLMGGAAAEQSKQALDPAKVSQAVLYMVSDLSGSRTGQFLFVSGARVAELKIVGPEGMKKEGFTARDIADNEAAVFLPKESGFNMYG